MKRPPKPDEQVTPDLPEWERCIVATVFEDVRPRRMDADGCTACVNRWTKAKEANPKTRWHEATCEAHPVSKREVTYQENREQYERFCLYRDTPDQEGGKPLSLRQVAATNGLDASALRWMETLSPRFRWVERRAAMKAAEKQKKREKRKKVREARDDLNEHRREEVLDAVYEGGKALLRRAADMLKIPLFETTVTRGGKTTIYKPIGTKQHDIATFYKVGKELLAFGAEMEEAERERGLNRGSSTGGDGSGSMGSSSVSAEAAHPDAIGPQLGSPREVIDRILIRFPSWMLEDALKKRLDHEGRAELVAQEQEDKERMPDPIMPPGDGGEA